MECWSIGILGVPAEINHFNCKKFLQNHQSIKPLFHHSLPGGGPWGEALNLHYTNSIILTSIFNACQTALSSHSQEMEIIVILTPLCYLNNKANFFETIVFSKTHPFKSNF